MDWKSGMYSPRIALMLILLAALLIPGISTAQNAPTRDWNNMGDTMEGAIGLHYGKLGGDGLSFRFPLRWYLYLQFGGGIWHTGDDQKHNLGTQINFILRQDAHLRLYLAGGVGYFYHREKTGESGGQDIWEKTEDWNTGAGVGVEYLLWPRVALQGELDFVHESSNGDIKVQAQVGIHYYW